MQYSVISIKKIINWLTVFLMLALMNGCGGSKKNDSVSPAPVAAQLTLPENNAACLTGTNVGATTSIISFSWKNAANTNSYELIIKNLLTGETVNTSTSTNKAAVSLALNTPFSWQIVSKSNSSSATATSETWKFYNAGTGQTFYAPFPANLNSPAAGQSVNAVGGALTLEWGGSDPDNDIAHYDIYFGTAVAPPLFKSALTTSSFMITVAPATKYYWKIITMDAQGNTSDSGVSDFSTN